MSTSCLSINNLQFNKKFLDMHRHQEQQQLSTIPTATTTMTTTTKIKCVKKKKTCLLKPSPMSLQKQTINEQTETLTSLTASSTKDASNELGLQNDERVNLIEKLNENHKTICEARNEYLKEYKNFIQVVYKYYDEKYVNLKLKFRNEVLKQQIYFESELYDISKECHRDYDYHINKLKLELGQGASRSSSANGHLQRKLKNIADSYLKLCKVDMKKLIGYMKDALLNSYDTLTEAYEACSVLKLIEKLLKQNNLNHVQLTNANKNSFKSIQHYLTDVQQCDSNNNDGDEHMRSASSSDSSDSESDTYSDEEVQIVKYRQEMENLMNSLDDIEVQYLQRKDQMQKKSKLFYQLKNKIKSIENKYDSLSKEVNNLKYESCVFKHLLNEKALTEQSCIEELSFSNQVARLSPCPSELSLLMRQSSNEEDEEAHTEQQQDSGDNDYNRKLNLLSNLINLHKTKRSSKQQQQSIKKKSSTLVTSNQTTKSQMTNEYSTLQLYECTCDGDLVTIENCNLKSDHDLTNWQITRQIDNMPVLSFKIPAASVCKSGKVLCIKTLFNDQLDFLQAIKNKTTSTTTNSKNISIRIQTKLISPEGKIASTHSQEIPQFYQEIFKYANLIGFY